MDGETPMTKDYIDETRRELTEKEVQKLERRYKRGFISGEELDYGLGKPEAIHRRWEQFFASDETQRITTEEFEEMYFEHGKVSKWRQRVKEEVMQEGDELWHWNNIGFMGPASGSTGIVLLHGNRIILKRLLRKA
jgi:hypothetical protein